MPMECSSSSRSIACTKSTRPALCRSLEGCPYKRAVTQLSPSRQPIAPCDSLSSSTHFIPSIPPFTFLTDRSSSMQRRKSNDCLRLYKTTMMAYRDYVALEPMSDRKTLSQYASRFPGALKNAFPGVKMETRRNLIDVFIEGLTRIYLVCMFNVKDEKCVKASR